MLNLSRIPIRFQARLVLMVILVRTLGSTQSRDLGTARSARRVNTNETAKACSLCPKNTYTLSGSIGVDGCTPCQNAGEYAKPGSGFCEKCPQYEEFDDLSGGCVCMTSFDRIGGTCTCKDGFTLMGTSCSPCELGKWKNESGVTSCTRCEDTLKGGITEFEGSMSQSSCICPRGFYDGGEGKCVEVKEGMNSEEDCGRSWSQCF